MPLYDQLGTIKQKLLDQGRNHPATMAFLDARMREAAALPPNMPYISELSILRRLATRRDVRDTDIEMDLLALMPDEEPEVTADVETEIHSTPRNHSFYKHQKQQRQGRR